LSRDFLIVIVIVLIRGYHGIYQRLVPAIDVQIQAQGVALVIKVGILMKIILRFVLVLLAFFCFSGCNHSTEAGLSNISKPTNEEAILILEKFNEIFMTIIRPTFEFLGENTGPTFTKETDYISIVAHFRDTDFSEEIDEMTNLYSQIPELESGEPEKYSIARVNMRCALYVGEYLCELGSNPLAA